LILGISGRVLVLIGLLVMGYFVIERERIKEKGIIIKNKEMFSLIHLLILSNIILNFDKYLFQQTIKQ